MLSTTFIQIILLVLNLTSPTGDVTEILHCVTEPLEAHSFVQQSEYDEYVCVNPADYTDFVIVADVHGDVNEGDTLLLGLSEYSEVIEQINVSGLQSADVIAK